MKMRRKGYVLAIVLLALLLAAGVSFAGTTERVSVDSSGNESNNWSELPSISSDGRYVAFDSPASNLVQGDTNGTYDVFVHDRTTNVTVRASVDSNGNQANGSSYWGPLSSDGRYVAFQSDANNLVSGDINGAGDIFVHDRDSDGNGIYDEPGGITIELVSVDSSGNQGDGHSWDPSLSADGRYVAFRSSATNLVSADTNGQQDIFVHDRVTGVTERVSVDSSGNQANSHSSEPSISGDGRYVAFISGATNLVQGDTNSAYDIFVHDRVTGVTERVSVDSSGNQANSRSSEPSISGDGRYVAFESSASNLVPGDTNSGYDVFVHDRVTGVTERVSVDSSGNQANGWSGSDHTSISGDGRYVAFSSDADNLVPFDNDTNGVADIFVRDRVKGITERVSEDSSGNQANGRSGWPAISGDGRHVAFESYASNLVPGDTNGKIDIFVRSGDIDIDGDGYRFTDCNNSDSSTYPTAPEIKHDGIDQDCNGYDLTIEITKAKYQAPQDEITVKATSDYGQAADLYLVEYQLPMTWTGGINWEIVIQPAGGDPGTVTVWGMEGEETAPVQ